MLCPIYMPPLHWLTRQKWRTLLRAASALLPTPAILGARASSGDSELLISWNLGRPKFVD